VIDATLSLPARAEATLVPVACGSVVSEPGDPQNGSLSGNVYKDLTATGITRLLIEALTADAVLNYSWAETGMTITGTARVAGHDQTFTPDKYGRHPLNITIATAVPTFS
jgi:hypothetical protein